MRFLLDVNALIAYGLRQHSLHARVATWVSRCTDDQFLTCSITELGFVRILAQVRTYGMDTLRARNLLLGLKSDSLPLQFIPDANDISCLAAWVQTPAQITDGHLVQLAHAHGAVLATLDQDIPGAFLIP